MRDWNHYQKISQKSVADSEIWLVYNGLYQHKGVTFIHKCDNVASIQRHAIYQ